MSLRRAPEPTTLVPAALTESFRDLPVRFSASAILLLGFLFVLPLRAQIIDTIAGNITAVDSRNARQIPLVIARAVALDPTGNFLYIGDDGGRTVRRIELSTGTSTIVAGGGTAVDDLFTLPGRAVSLVSPVALAVDGGGNVLIVDDTNHRIRRLTPDGRISTIVGNGVFGYSGDGGPALRAQLALPGGVALDHVGNIYIADRFSYAIRRVDRFTNIITTVVGGDPDEASLDANVVPAQKAYLFNPTAVTVDPQGNVLIADSDAHMVYRYEPQTGLVRRIAGSPTLGINLGDGKPALDAFLEGPQGVAVAPNGDIYIGTLGAVRKISAATGIISTVVGNGPFILGENRDGRAVGLSSGVAQIAITPGGDRMFFATGGDHVIAELNLHTNVFSIVAGSTEALGDRGLAQTAALGQPDKLALDRAGNLYVADFFHHRIRKIERGASGTGSGQISTVAGSGIRTAILQNGPALSSAIGFPRGITVAPNGDVIFTDSFRFIRRLDANGNLTTIAGQTETGYNGDDRPATTARINDPHAVISDSIGNLYIADTENHRVRKIDVSGRITTIAGTGVAGSQGEELSLATEAQLNRPTDLFVVNDEFLFIADSGNRRVLVLFLDTGRFLVAVTLRGTLSSITMNPRGDLFIGGLNRILLGDFTKFTVETIAGDGNVGFTGDGGLATLARTSLIGGMVVDAEGNLIFSDLVSNRIRRISSTRVLPSLSVGPPSLRFSATQGGAAPAEQNIAIRSGNLVNTTWTAAARMLDGQGWLSLGAGSGATPALPAVKVDPSRLTPGTYAGTVTIIAPGAANSPTTVSVSLVVSPALAPKLDIGPQQVSFRALQGNIESLTQIVLLNNDGGGVLSYSSAVATGAGGSWLAVVPPSGTGPARVNITVSPAGLASGTYQGEVRFTNRSPGLPSPDSQSVFVTLVIEPARPALRLSQTSAVFTSSEQSSFVPPQQVSIINSGTGNAAWTASVTPLSGGDWLALSARSGTARPGAPSRISLSASPAASGRTLAAGVYDTLITLSAPGAANSPQVLLARLRVEGAAGLPIPTVTPGGFLVSVESGDARTRVGNISLSSSGGAALNYNASVRTNDGGAWLTLDATGGSLVSSADAVQFPIRILPGGLRVGTYRGQVTFSFNPAGGSIGGGSTNASNANTAEVSVVLVIAPSAAAISGAAFTPSDTVSADTKLPPRAACNPEVLIPQITSITNNLQLPVGWPAGIRATVVDNCGSVAPRASVIATIVPPPTGSATASAEHVSLTPLGDGQYSANYNLARAGDYPIFVTAAGAGLQAGRSETVVASSSGGGAGGNLQTPTVGRDGVVSGASFRSFANLAPGQIVSVFGSNLAAAPSGALTTPLPTELAGVSIILGGQRMPLYFSGANQLNAQVPFELPTGSELPLVVTLGGRASPPEVVSLARSSPGVFTVNESGQGSGVITDAAGVPISATNPARRGEVIIAYGTGLGATTPAVPSGSVSPSSPPAQTTLPVRATLNAPGSTAVIAAPVEFAGLTPGFVGLYQVNIRVPADAPTGPAVELTLEQDGATSTPVTLAVQ